MHLAYRNRKQTLPVVPLQDNKLAPYYAKNSHSPTPNNSLSRKKSIDLILDKHISRHTQHPLVYKSFRKTNYRSTKAHRADSGALAAYAGERDEARGEGRVMSRNKSTQLGDKGELTRKRSDLVHFAPYETKRKSRSITRLQRAEPVGPTQPQNDWLCERFIQREVYSLSEPSDFY